MKEEGKEWKKLVGQTLEVQVTPKASSNRIKAEIIENGSLKLRVYVTAVPEEGKANEAVIKLLAKELGVPKSSLTIIQGQTSRRKVFRLG